MSDAEVAETPYTAFTSRPAAQQVTARLIVRRVRRLNPDTAADQGELFPGYRHHAVFTDSRCQRSRPRGATGATPSSNKSSPTSKPGRSPTCRPGRSRRTARGCLRRDRVQPDRAAGWLASLAHSKATTGTLRAQLITIPRRLARSARRLMLHLPLDWPWVQPWTQLFTTGCGPPPT